MDRVIQQEDVLLWKLYFELDPLSLSRNRYNGSTAEWHEHMNVPIFEYSQRAETF